MQYTFTEVKAVYPKRTYRSKRTLKKMHLQEFREMLIDIHLPAPLFDTEKEWELLDAIYEFDDNTFVFGDLSSTNIMIQVPADKFDPESVKQYCLDLLTELSAIDLQFAEIESIVVNYGDAYYGEW